MKSLLINKKIVRVYDSIDEMPIINFQKYNKYLLIDSGIGSDADDIDAHIVKIAKYIKSNNNRKALQELQNMRQNIYMVNSEISPKYLAFAALIHSVDGKEVNDLSDDGLRKIVAKVSPVLTGKVAVKLHTGEKGGPNILPREWVKELLANDIKNASIVETNTYYPGDRDTTAKHLDTLKVNGWTFAPVDIMDADGTAMIPVKGAKHIKEISVGKGLLKYDSLLTLTHFKGHTMGGFGGSNKNISIGCADAHTGKKQLHAGATGQQWGITGREFMENMVDATKGITDHFKGHVCYVNVLRRMSVDCDCAGTSAEPPRVPDIGIFASLDLLAVEQASVDAVYDLGEASAPLRERIETRHGLRQLSAMREIGLGSENYEIVDLDKA